MKKILFAAVIAAGAIVGGAASAAPVHAPMPAGFDRAVGGGTVQLARDGGHGWHRGWSRRHHGWRRGHHYGWRPYRHHRRHWRPHHWRHRHWR